MSVTITVHLVEPLDMLSPINSLVYDVRPRLNEKFTNLVNRVAELENIPKASIKLGIIGCEILPDRRFDELKSVLQMTGINWERGLTRADRFKHPYMITNNLKSGMRAKKEGVKVHLLDLEG